jgi:hypothetical protein
MVVKIPSVMKIPREDTSIPAPKKSIFTFLLKLGFILPSR